MEEIKIRDTRKKGWFIIDNEYLNGYARILGASCTVVYLSLCRHANTETQECFPSMKLIAEENGISTRTVMRAISVLEKWHIINVEKSKREDGTQNNNIYTLMDKSVWKSKPSDTKSHGQPSDKIVVTPSDNNDINRVTPGTYKGTNINNTNIKGTNKSSLEIDTKFWELYPVKIAKYKASISWNKLTEIEKGLAIIAIKKQVESNHFRGRDGKDYIPHPATWLNQKRWQDEVKEIINLDFRTK